MPRKFDKKNAKTFSVVHRSHDDALFYDNDASAHVLVPAPSKTDQKQAPTKKIFSTAELAQKFSPEELESVRENEGLAAQYGVYFDDSKYDYMQHLRPIGAAQDAVYIAASKEEEAPKKKDITELFKDQMPLTKTNRADHDLEDIPAEFRGFNPDLDPRLREMLEALEDEAYIDDNEAGDGEDIFTQLLHSGEVEDEDEFYYGSDADHNDDYDEWDLDNYKEEYQKYDSDQEKLYNEGEEPEDAVAPPVASTGWERDFQQFKKASKNNENDWDSDDDFEGEDEDEVPDLPAFAQKKVLKTKLRKKKGAMTDTSSFSMSSSAVYRTEGLTLLDDRYEQLAKKFDDDEDTNVYEDFSMENERADLEDMLDDFLDNFELESGGRRLVKKDDEKKRLQEAADSVSRGKLAAKRKSEKEKNSDPFGKLGGSFGNLKI